jgi:hypothetical protein
MSELLTKIQQALADFWDERALPSSFDGATTVEELVAPIESMTAVEVLATLDAIVDDNLPNTVIQAGGYSSKEEFIEKLSEKVMSHIVREK